MAVAKAIYEMHPGVRYERELDEQAEAVARYERWSMTQAELFDGSIKQKQKDIDDFLGRMLRKDPVLVNHDNKSDICRKRCRGSATICPRCPFYRPR